MEWYITAGIGKEGTTHAFGADGSRRVLDVVCTQPRTGAQYVIDARVFWNSMSEGPTGYVAYSQSGRGAEQRAAKAAIVARGDG